jgi:hypothetical protein
VLDEIREVQNNGSDRRERRREKRAIMTRKKRLFPDAVSLGVSTTGLHFLPVNRTDEAGT